MQFTGVLQYAINGGSYQSSANFNNLAAGNYTVTVQDANGCTASTTTNITDAPSAVIVNITTTPVGCNGQSDGTVDIVANSGTAPLNYSIDNGLTFQAGSFFSGLAAGSYSIVVSDANGCTTTSSINVVEPTTLILNLNSVNTTCSQTNYTTCSQTNGSVSAIANGGTPAYQFSIDAGVTFQASASFGGLATGVYSIVVQDANGCTASGSINISDAPGPHMTMWLLLTLIAMVQIADQLLLQLQMVLHLCNFLLIMEQLISLEMYLIVCRQEVTI